VLVAAPTVKTPTRPWIALVLLAGFGVSHVLGAEEASAHRERQAVLLSDFLQFVHWPEDTFESASDELRVQIIGRDPFNGALDRMLAGERVGERRVVVTHVNMPAFSPLPHVAFISASEEPRTAALLAAYCRKPVLTISDIEGFANHGGVVGLVEGGLFELIEDDHAVHFTVNRTALYEARLQIGPQRLHLAYPLFSAVSPCGARPAG
jgi:hypothetical protein